LRNNSRSRPLKLGGFCRILGLFAVLARPRYRWSDVCCIEIRELIPNFLGNFDSLALIWSPAVSARPRYHVLSSIRVHWRSLAVLPLKNKISALRAASPYRQKRQGFKKQDSREEGANSLAGKSLGQDIPRTSGTGSPSYDWEEEDSALRGRIALPT
jgi:hypothetical protein